MAIAFDSAASGQSTSSPLNFSHTIGGGTNRLVVVTACTIGTNSAPTVTYNGVTMTQIITDSAGAGGTRVRATAYSLLEASLPVAGTYTVAVTQGNADEFVAGAVSVTQAAQQVAEASNSGSATGSPTSINTNITTLTDDAWVFDIAGKSAGSLAFTQDSPQEERWEEQGTILSGAGSTEATGTLGVQNLGWSFASTGANAIHVLVAFEGIPDPDVKVKKGTFTTPAATGNDAVTGVGFTPAAIILWHTPVQDENVNVNASHGFGIADNATPTINQIAISVASENGAGDNFRLQNEAVVLQVLLATSDTPVALATVASYDSDGFTLNYSSASSGYIIHYLALGGDDLTSFVGQSLASASPVTGVPFQPELVFCMTSGQAAGNISSAHGLQSFGVFNDALDQWWVGSYQGNDGVDQEDKDSVLFTSGFIGQIFQAVLTWEIVISTITSDGFSWTGTNTDVFYFLALNLNGVNHFVGNFTKSTGTAPVGQELPDFGFIPQMYMAGTGYEVDQVATTPNNCRVACGAITTFNGRAQGHTFRTDVLSTTNADQRTNTVEVIGGGDSDAVYDSLALAQSPTSSQTPSVTWNPNDSNAVIIGVWGIEQTEAVGDDNALFFGSVF